MKRYIYHSLLALMSVALLLTSCKEDDDDMVYSDLCYISGFSLGSMHRVIPTVDSEGNPSSYTLSFSGSHFPMTIDQRNQTIENLDSLPLGSRVSAVLASVKAQGVVAWRRQSDTTGKWKTYSATDSIDFSSPLHFLVASTDGTATRTYTVKVNVHQQKGDTTTWKRMAEPNTELAAASELKLVMLENKLVAFTTDKNYTLTDASWVAAANSTALNVETIQQSESTLYASAADGSLVTSTDGAAWTALSSEGITLVGVADRFYGIKGDELYSSADGITWNTKEERDSEDALPTQHVNFISHAGRLFLMGAQTGDATMRVWSKSQGESTWMFYPVNRADKYRLPVMDHVTVANYDNGMLALGGDMSKALHSQDQGITWLNHSDKGLAMIDELQVASKKGSASAVTTDDEHHLWILVGGELWRGRINRLGFQRQDR